MIKVLLVVTNRKAERLLTIIQDHVLPSLKIYSNKWAANNKISELHSNQVSDQTVNHIIKYADPDKFNLYK